MTKTEIYNYINKNKMKFLGSNNGNYDEKMHNWIISEGLDVPVYGFQNIYDYLNDNKGKYCKCGNINVFNSFSRGYRKFCSKKCLYDWRSNKMIGENNNIYKASKETLKEMGRKNSIRIKESISNGTFTPNVTNSWAKSRCIIKIKRNDKTIEIKLRSSWDAYFQLKNPNLIYEKIRIPYFLDGVFHNYIVDFVDIENKIIYEIKPGGLESSEINQIKFKTANEWCNINGYEFKIISNEWFESNYDESILEEQPDKDKMKRLLKQFKK
jgi:hypothetical protein